ncbi:MAG TPA: hypothetical protein VNH12_03825 [Burkholderiales bacterium]|nr:hypothetical protein [Burkholderiales bacterium]
MFRTLCAAALAAITIPALAQESETSKLREEIRQMQQRLDALEAQSGPPQSESAFNPAISAILNGIYANLQRDPATYRLNGFVPTLGEVAPPRRGLSLGESELAVSANADHLFRGTLIASISSESDGVQVEEGYIETLALSYGFTLKAGRFFSGIGYQNQIHAHAWDFTDAPLAMKAFLGNQLGDDGVQLKWVAPTTALYVDLGAEAGRGRAFPGSDRDKNGFGSSNLFAHLGGDLGESTSWLAGLSYYQTSPRDRAYTDLDSTGASVDNSFSGSSKLWALSGVLKWAPDGNAASRSFKLQGEYFRRKEDGTLTYDTRGASLGTMSGDYASRQSGWYLQGVYQFMPAWRVGYRYDQLDAGSATLGLVDSGALTAADFPLLQPYNPKRHTAMVDWSASEFSRVRLQLARDYSRRGEPDNQLFLQYIVSLGAHGAHKF